MKPPTYLDTLAWWFRERGYFLIGFVVTSWRLSYLSFSSRSTAGHSPLTHYPTARRIYYQPCYEGIAYCYSLLPHWHPSFLPSSSSSHLPDSHLENVYGAPHARTRSAFPLPTSGLVPFSALTSKSSIRHLGGFLFFEARHQVRDQACCDCTCRRRGWGVL